MSYYIVKIYGLVCDICDDASEEYVPKIDESNKLAATRRALASDPGAAHGPWTRRHGKDVCAKCAAQAEAGESATQPDPNEET